MQYENGIYTNMSEEEYHAIEGRVSASSIKTLNSDSPYSFRYSKTIDKGGIGKAVHKYCEKLDSKSVLSLPDEKGYSTLDTIKSQEFVLRYPDRIVLSSKDYESYDHIVNAIKTREDDETSYVRAMLEMPTALREFVILFDIEGIPAKARIDYYLPETRTLVDFKTTKEGRSKFKRDYNQLGYWLQLHFYSLALATHFKIDMYEVTPLIFSFQTAAPYIVQSHQVTYDADATMLMYSLCAEWSMLKQGKIKPYNYFKSEKSILNIESWTQAEISRRIKDIAGK